MRQQKTLNLPGATEVTGLMQIRLLVHLRADKEIDSLDILYKAVGLPAPSVRVCVCQVSVYVSEKCSCMCLSRVLSRVNLYMFRPNNSVFSIMVLGKTISIFKNFFSV